MIRKNLELGRALRVSAWRKISIGSWKNTGDSTVYGLTQLDAEAALQYLEEARQKSGLKITMTHLIGKVLAETYQRHPDMNVIGRWGRVYPRKNIDIFFQVAMDDSGEDLSGAVVRKADQKSLEQICADLSQSSKTMRGGNDLTFKKIKKNLKLVPGFLLPFMVRFTDFLLNDLNIWMPFVGTPPDSFGSVMVTSIGSLGLSDIAFAPIPKFSRLPMLLCVGAVHEAPVVRNGQVAVGKIINLTISFDHRFLDGVAAGRMLRTFRDLFHYPEKLESIGHID